MAPIWDDLKNAFDRSSGSDRDDADDKAEDSTMQSDEPIESETVQQRVVQCVKLGRELPGLEQPPFPGELGRRIYENVSQYAYEMWKEHQTLIINHYGLNLADPQARQVLMQEMEAFFFEDQAEVPEDWVPEDQEATGPAPVPGPQGKGGGSGGPQRKGGGGPFGPQHKGGGPPAPQRK